MTEIDKRNFKNYLYITFGITYIAWGLLAIFTQSHILGLETFIGRILHIIGALGPAIASGFYLNFRCAPTVPVLSLPHGSDAATFPRANYPE